MRFKVLLTFLFLLFGFNSFGVEEPADLTRVCFGEEQNELYWENPEDICGTFERNVIYHSPQGDEFEPVDTVFDFNVEEYQHSGGNNSRYFIKTYYDCFGEEGFYSDTLMTDDVPPENVQIDSISYHNGEWVMGWEPTSDDIEGYVVYLAEEVDGDVDGQRIDTLFGRDNSQYVIPEDEDLSEEQFGVAAFDTCRNISAISSPHQGMLMDYSTDECEGRVTFEWNEYIGWDEGVEKYELLQSSDGPMSSDFEVVREIEDFDGEFVMDDFPLGEEFCFFARAHRDGEGDISASSSRVCFETDFVEGVDDMYLQSVDVIDENESIEVQWEVSGGDNINRYEIRRGPDSTTQETIDNVNHVGGQEGYTYIDDDVSPERNEYFYEIRAIDICDNVSDTSNLGNNILLQGTFDEEIIKLNWSEYWGWNSGVDEYILERTLTKTIPFVWEDRGVFPEGQLSFNDTISIEEVGNEGICYRVTAREDETDPFGNLNTAISNRNCFTENAIVHIPNAFNPDGLNEVFNIDGLFIDFKESRMEIYNRWGEEVFESDNLRPEEGIGGWDGTAKDSDEVLSEGVYFYIVHVTGQDGQREMFKGEVHLVR